MEINLEKAIEKLADDFGVDKKRSIGEVAQELGVETHVIRFWEENFPQIKPEIGRGGRRYYYNKQIKVVKNIKKFLHEDGYTIAGLQKMLKKRKTNQIDEIEKDLQMIVNSGEQSAKFCDDANNISANVISNLSAKSCENENENLAQKTDEKREIMISDFINPSVDLSGDFSHNIKKKPKDEILSLTRNISKNLGELKFLLRS